MAQIDSQNPTNAIRSKPLERRAFDPELGLETLTYRQEVPHGTLLTSPTWALSEQVEFHNTAKSWLTTVNPIPLPVGNNTSPEKVIGKDCGSQALSTFSCCTERISKLVKTGDPEIPRAFGEISRSYSVLNAGTGVYKILRASGGYMELESVETDEDRTKYTVTRSVIANATPVPADTVLDIYSTERIDCEHRVLVKKTVTTAGSFTYEEEDTQDTCLKIVNTVADVSVITLTPTAGQQTRLTPKGPLRFRSVIQTLQGWTVWSRITRRTINYNFPSRLTTLGNPTAIFTPQQRRSMFFTTPVVKVGYSGPVEARIVETLVNAVPGSLTALFAPQPEAVQYDGVLFNLSIPEVLHDAISLSATTDSRDSFWGSAVDSFSKTATVPTATAYNLLVGSEVCISDVVEPYGRFCLYKRTRTYITVQ